MSSYQDLVEQQTITTGTGAYTVSGTVVGRRTFLTAYPADATLVPYVVTDDAGAFECGLGAWNHTTLQLTRTVVTSSSNSNAAVSWAAGTKRIFVAEHSALLGLSAMKHNLNALAAPTVTDDSASGYGIGSVWGFYPPTSGQFDLPSIMYACESSAVGAAEWRAIPSWKHGDDIAPMLTSSVVRDGQANASYGPGSSTNALRSGNDYADGARIAYGAFTTDATPTKLSYKGAFATNGGIYCEGKSCTTLTGSISALDTSSGDIASWKVEAVLEGAADGTVTVRAGSAPTSLYASAGASTWSVAVIGSAASGWNCTVEVTGEAATTINWSASLLLGTAVSF